MSIYLYWGEDDFALEKAVAALLDRTLDPQWASFNYDKIPEDQPNAITQGLNQAMTAPFGVGGRLVWLVNTTICHHCPEELLAELERTIPEVPESSVLLLTTPNKPDGRVRSTKLLQRHADIREFSLIPPWKTEQLVQRVRQCAQELGMKLTAAAAELLAQSVGNDTRQLFNELEKLQIYTLSSPSASSLRQAQCNAGQRPPKGGVIDVEAVAALVTTNTHNSLQLADAIAAGNTSKSLEIVADLIECNEPALKIVATLTGKFRTWLWVKVAIESGRRDDRAIAQAAEVSNPQRIRYLRQEVSTLSVVRLSRTLQVLLELEVSLKRGADASTLQTKVIELCQLKQ